MDPSRVEFVPAPAPNPWLPVAAHRGISLFAILASLLIVALATVAAASTWVALRATEERSRAKEDFAVAQKAIDRYIETIAMGNELKGSNQAAARQALYQPAVDYYQKFVQTHENDPTAMPQMAEAYYHLAGLLAKKGDKGAGLMLSKGLGCINRMKLANADPATFPSFQECALKYTLPTEWVTFRGISGAEQRGNLAPLLLNFELAMNNFDELAKLHPQTTTFRDDLAGVVRIPATLFGFANVNDRAVRYWERASAALETLVRDRPDNLDYKLRLAEALDATASRQRSAGRIEEAVASYQREIDVREKIVAADPEDKTRQQELTTAKRGLERAKTTKTKTAKKETPATDKAAETPAPTAPDGAPAAETPAVEAPSKSATEPAAADAPAATDPPAAGP